MEFKSKYSSSKSESTGIPNTLYEFVCNGLKVVQKEIESLENKIDSMGTGAPKMFYKKIDLLVDLGNHMVKVKECYEFNKR